MLIPCSISQERRSIAFPGPEDFFSLFTAGATGREAARSRRSIEVTIPISLGVSSIAPFRCGLSGVWSPFLEVVP